MICWHELNTFASYQVLLLLWQPVLCLCRIASLPASAERAQALRLHH